MSTAALGAVVAFLVAAASAGVLRPYSPAAGLRRAGELARVPLGDRARAVRAAIVLAVGIAAIVEPETTVRVLVIVLAAVLVYAAVATRSCAIAGWTKSTHYAVQDSASGVTRTSPPRARTSTAWPVSWMLGRGWPCSA